MSCNLANHEQHCTREIIEELEAATESMYRPCAIADELVQLGVETADVMDSANVATDDLDIDDLETSSSEPYLMTENHIMQQLRTDTDLGAAEAGRYARRIAAQRVLRALYTTWRLRSYAQVPNIHVYGYNLHELMREHKLSPLHAIIALNHLDTQAYLDAHSILNTWKLGTRLRIYDAGASRSMYRCSRSIGQTNRQRLKKSLRVWKFALSRWTLSLRPYQQPNIKNSLDMPDA